MLTARTGRKTTKYTGESGASYIFGGKKRKTENGNMGTSENLYANAMITTQLTRNNYDVDCWIVICVPGALN